MFGINCYSSQNGYSKLEENSEDATELPNSLSFSSQNNRHDGNFSKRQLERSAQEFQHDQECDVKIASQSKKHKFSHASSASAPNIEDVPVVISNRKKKASEEAVRVSGKVIKKSVILSEETAKEVFEKESPSLAEKSVVALKSADCDGNTSELQEISSSSLVKSKTAEKSTFVTTNESCDISSSSLKIGSLRNFVIKVKDGLYRTYSRLSQQINWYNIPKMLNSSRNHIDATHEALSPVLGDAIIKIILDYDQNKYNYIIKTLQEEFYISDFVKEIVNSETVLELDKYQGTIKNVAKILNIFKNVKVLNTHAKIRKISCCEILTYFTPIKMIMRKEPPYGFKGIGRFSPRGQRLGFAVSTPDMGKYTTITGFNYITDTNVADLNASKNLEKINIKCSSSFTEKGLVQLVNYHPNLKSIALHYCSHINNISSLLNLKNLEYLAFTCSPINDISTLAGLEKLESLNLQQCMRIENINLLSNLKNLEHLDLSECLGIADFNPLEGFVKLKSLKLNGCMQIIGISFLSNLNNLECLDLSECRGITDFNPLEGFVKLESLKLNGCKQIKDISFLSNLNNLEHLDLSQCEGITNFSPLAVLEKLESLNLQRCEQIKDISFLSNFKDLECLDLSECHGITDFGPLEGFVKLKSLKLNWCRQITDISFLSNLKNLEYLDLSQCEGITDFSPLAGLLNLKSLKLNQCKHFRDTSLLLNLKNLEHLGLMDWYNSDITSKTLENFTKLKSCHLPNDFFCITDLFTGEDYEKMDMFQNLDQFR